MGGLYSGGGDAGLTSLGSGERVSKCCSRVEALGTLDELQASLGLARAFAARAETAEAIRGVQCTLGAAMADLAQAGGSPRIGATEVAGIEQDIDRLTAKLPGGFAFRIPGDAAGSAALHAARTVARRAERCLHRLAEDEEVSAELRAYVNRLSDFCYALACYEDDVSHSKEA